ncbi:DUF4252 domain-containing protein [Prolixibacteraceae bacterium Z1-6]|uniref:DUF4252 domain-containing protein n=1 Tax=Draconibacterium aestuarii TaxID=2998507 RepID=A0A9X3F563_9BACT|nr:DUF4252 domain-containing protein [Prolixibacteraceae bacterium Z1-6]
MKTITTLIFALAFLLATLLAGAQSKSDKMYDVFSGRDGVTNFTFSKNMIETVNIDLGDEGDEQNVTGDLHKIRFLSYNAEKGDLSADQFTKKVIAMLPSQYKKFEDDSDNEAEIWLLGKKRKFTECHIFTKGESNQSFRFVVSFYGDFTVNDIEKLKNKGKDFAEE